MHKFIIFSVLVFISNAANALTTKDYLQKAIRAYAAFECSVFARNIKNKNESNRLFNVGYKNALSFVKAYKSKIVSNENILLYAPINSVDDLDRAYTNTPEFTIGRMFTTSIYNARGRMNTNKDINKNFAERENRANNLYNTSNCSLIR